MCFVVTVANSQVPYEWGDNLRNYQDHSRQMNTHRACHLLTMRNSRVSCRHVNLKKKPLDQERDGYRVSKKPVGQKKKLHTHTVLETVDKPIY